MSSAQKSTAGTACNAVIEGKRVTGYVGYAEKLPGAIFTDVLGDVTWVAPILLVQVGVLQPIALAILDGQRARVVGTEVSLRKYLTLPFRNPITLAVLLGLAFAVWGRPVPELLSAPLTLVGGMAVPMMLMAFGISLRLDPLPGLGPHAVEVWVIQTIKLVGQPLIAFGLGVWIFHLTHATLLAVTVLGALSAATNINVIALRYRTHEQVARDSVFWSTILCMPVILAITALLS